MELGMRPEFSLANGFAVTADLSPYPPCFAVATAICCSHGDLP